MAIFSHLKGVLMVIYIETKSIKYEQISSNFTAYSVGREDAAE